MDLKNQKNWIGLLVVGIVYAILQNYVDSTVGGLVSGAAAWVVWIIYFAIVYVVATYIFEAINKKK